MEILIVYTVAFYWIWIKLLEYLNKDLESIDTVTGKLIYHYNLVHKIMVISVSKERSFFMDEIIIKLRNSYNGIDNKKHEDNERLHVI